MSAFIEAASPHTMNTYGRLPIALTHGQGCRVWDINGKEWSGKVHGDWALQDLRLKGRTLDLSHAYKQLPTAAADHDLCIVAVYNPETDQVEWWQHLALQFGSTSDVYAFNLFSRVIERAATELLLIPLTSYFDDFPMVEVEPLCSSASSSMEMLLGLLGWEFAGSGSKALPFDAVFKVLGVDIDGEEGKEE